MPPKIKISKKDILKTALEMLRQNGEKTINARNIATALDCSTQPIFSNFSTMEELQTAILETAYEHYLGFLKSEAESGKYPPYKAFGMAYIRFAKEEKELFRFLFMRDCGGKEFSPTPDFEASVEILMSAHKISREKAERMHMEMWVCVHGIATILATSFVEFEQSLISDMLTDVYQGLRARLVTEVKE